MSTTRESPNDQADGGFDPLIAQMHPFFRLGRAELVYPTLTHMVIVPFLTEPPPIPTTFSLVCA